LTLIIFGSLSPAALGATSYSPTQNIVKAGDFVTLSGEGVDPDDDSLTIFWRQIGGETVNLLPSANVAEPTFQAPDVENGKVKILTFELTVQDPYGGVDTDIIKITVMPRNQPPTADAGADQTVQKGDEVTLSGDGTDPDGDPLTFHWSQIDGPVVDLDDPDSQSPTIDTSQMSRSSGTLRYQLTVTDGFGGLARDTVVIKVTAASPTLISASAGNDQTVDEGTTVELEGTCNDRLDRELSYAWTQTLGPFAELSSTADADPTFVAPEIPNGAIVPLAFRFSCSAAEGGGTATDVVIIRVRPVNDDPTADAGPDKETLSFRIQYLAGSGSDPDGDRLQYSWRQTDGDEVELVYANRANARFLTPEVAGGASTELTFELTVTDQYGGEDTDEVTITVRSSNVRASADAGADQVVDEQTEVTLAGVGEDIDSDEIAFEWRQVGGEAVELSATDEPEPTFIAPVVENGKTKVLVFELRVSDESGHPAKDVTKVTVLPVNSPPVVDAGEGATVDAGDVVTLSGSASDGDDDPLTFLWSQTAGTGVSLSTETELVTEFTAPKVPVDTTFTFQLIANDGLADSEPSTVDVVVVGEISKKITAYAGRDQTVEESSSVTLFGSGKDPLKHKLFYSWRQVSGEEVALSATDLAKPSFDAPEVGNGETKTLVFELTVSDDEGRSASDRVSITVEPINGDPTAFAKVKSVREPV
jgi:hypothetical protein